LNIKDVKLGPETTGKLSQIGSLEEILALCEQVEQTQLVIDWSHLHARDRGRFLTVEDFRRVVELVEGKLGSETAQNMHCHFTRVEFSYKGERRHRVLDEAGYGPDFAKLAKVIAEFHLKPVIISETPLLDLDAMKMRDIFRKEMQSRI
jgi:deoxyribonuclease-4